MDKIVILLSICVVLVIVSTFTIACRTSGRMLERM